MEIPFASLRAYRTSAQGYAQRGKHKKTQNIRAIKENFEDILCPKGYKKSKTKYYEWKK